MAAHICTPHAKIQFVQSVSNSRWKTNLVNSIQCWLEILGILGGTKETQNFSSHISQNRGAGVDPDRDPESGGEDQLGCVGWETRVGKKHGGFRQGKNQNVFEKRF